MTDNFLKENLAGCLLLVVYTMRDGYVVVLAEDLDRLSIRSLLTISLFKTLLGNPSTSCHTSLADGRKRSIVHTLD